MNDSEAPQVDPQEYRPCYGCGMLVRLRAVKCRFCGVALPPGPSLPEMARQTADKLSGADTMDSRGEFPHDRLRKTGKKFRSSTLLFGGILLAGILVCAFVDEFGLNMRQREQVAIWGGITILVSLIATTLCLLQDIYVPGWEACRTPHGAIRTFLRALRAHRWAYAYALRLPTAQEEDLHRHPAIDELRLKARLYSFNDVRRFRTYWQRLLRGEAGAPRNGTLRILSCEPINDANAFALLRFEGNSYNPNSISNVVALGLIFMICILPFLFPVFLAILYFSHRQSRQQYSFECGKWLHRVGECWYLVNGGIFTGEDMLPRLYPAGIDLFMRGELPGQEILERAAGAGQLEHADPAIDEQAPPQ